MALRVAHVVETLGTGGAEKLVVDLVGALAAAGEDAFLFQLGASGPLADLVPPSVNHQCLGLNPRSLASHAQTVTRLRALVRTHRIQVLQTHLPMANFYGLTVGGGTRVLATIHNNREFDYGASAHPVRKRLRRAAYRRMASSGRGMVAVSDAVRDAMVGELGFNAEAAARIAVVTNGVRVPALVAEPQRAALRRTYGVGEGDCLVVNVGRLSPQKNQADLVRALAGLPEPNPAWRCVVAGEGALRPDLEAQIAEAGLSDRIILAGEVQDIEGLLMAADIFVLPSRWEGLPLALLEAMAAGLPVAAYDIPGVAEVLGPLESAALVPVDRVDLLADGLQTLMGDADARRRQGQAARRHVSEIYGLDRVVDQLMTLYRDGV